MNAIWTCLIKKYCVFAGRAPRSEYCVFLAACVVLTIVFKALGAALLFLPLVSVTVRRLHDCGISGYALPGAFFVWLLLARIPLLGALAGCALAVIFFILIFLKGTDGPNAYGRDPLRGTPPPPTASHSRNTNRRNKVSEGAAGRCSRWLRGLLHGKPTCPNCSAYVAADDRYCKTCGFDLDEKAGKTCPDCGAALEDDGFYCPKCGARVR